MLYLCSLKSSELQGNGLKFDAKINKSIVTNNKILVFLCKIKNN